MKQVTVIDYGLGNLLSVRRALEHLGAEVLVTDRPEEVASAERLVLPGVGAFGDGMAGLRSRGLVEPLENFVERGRPFLGICLGMQLMFDSSEEFGPHQGLGLLPGKVVAMAADTAAASPERRRDKVPHVGWSPIELPPQRRGWQSSLLAGLTPGEHLYFVHSFTAVPANEEHRLANCPHGGTVITAAVASGNVHGCQFHPEKSGPAGLAVIAAFINW